VNFDPSFHGSLWIEHGGIVDSQKYQNAITGKIEVRIGKGFSDSK